MKVKQIYEKYFCPENLQEHMLRVAALAEIILEQWKGAEVDKQAIVWACLFHDIAKPINFDTAGSDHLKSVYGSDEHRAAVKMCGEIGLGKKVVGLVNNIEWKFIPSLMRANDIEALVPIYCDMRIGPKGILPLDERLKDLGRRREKPIYEDYIESGRGLERLIRENTDAEVTKISDEDLSSRFEKLQGFLVILPAGVEGID